MNRKGNRTGKGTKSRKGAGKDPQDLEVEWPWGEEGEGTVNADWCLG